jgi:hypothetical protein
MPVPKPHTACPVAAIALESQRYVDAMIEAERAKDTASKDRPEDRWRHERRWSEIFELLHARRGATITTKAVSADGALHQLAIASALADELWELTPEQADNSADYFKAKEIKGLLQWALYSVAGVLERAASNPRDRLGVEYYMIRDADPFAVTALSQGGAA